VTAGSSTACASRSIDSVMPTELRDRVDPGDESDGLVGIVQSATRQSSNSAPAEHANSVHEGEHLAEVDPLPVVNPLPAGCGTNLSSAGKGASAAPSSEPLLPRLS
jgi:hypothetical protein